MVSFSRPKFSFFCPTLTALSALIGIGLLPVPLAHAATVGVTAESCSIVTSLEDALDFIRSTEPFTTQFNRCVDSGGTTETCEEQAIQTAVTTLTATTFVSFPIQEPQQPSTPNPNPTTETPVTEEKPKYTPEQIREIVNKLVCRYWLNRDKDAPGGGDQDGDQIPDRVDRDSYNGHGVRQAYPEPIPGSRRQDHHFNCEYFALYYRDAFVQVCGPHGGQCWIIHYDGHATIAWEFMGCFCIVEPQGGSSYFTDIPDLTLDHMPGPGQSATVGGARVYNYRKCNWLDISEPDPTPPQR